MYYRITSDYSYDNEHFNQGWVPSKKDSKKEKEEFFYEKDKAGRIVCTTTEFTETIEYGEQFLFEYMAQIVRTEYLIFKDEYIHALDKIGYCDMFNMICNNSDDEYYDARGEMTEYMNSFQLTYYGNKSVDLFKNKLALFINIFYEMIVGFDPNIEIKLLCYN
jgi:hypothetical protein